MMKKFFLLMCALIGVAVLLSSVGCKRVQNKDPQAPDFVLVVGLDPGFPPYGFRNEKGELVGFDLDLAKEVAKRRGWKIEFKPIDWDAKDAELDTWTINCIWNGFTMSEDRLDKYTWTTPYVNASQVVAVKNNSDIQTLADLAGHVVDTQKDSSGLEAINSEEHAALKASLKKLTPVENYQIAFMELETGACEAVIVDDGVARDFLQKRPDQFRILEETLQDEQYGVGFKLGNNELRDLVQETLNQMITDGTFKAISQKWFNGVDMSIRE
ncbi:MAG: amino acid ABC transporter substrate-binding protein [Victivallales bacterium]|nr:amino acid ABC transporter substrate-binding protein [Victivallales bacterium]